MGFFSEGQYMNVVEIKALFSRMMIKSGLFIFFQQSQVTISGLTKLRVHYKPKPYLRVQEPCAYFRFGSTTFGI